jgi:hypothetical protein
MQVSFMETQVEPTTYFDPDLPTASAVMASLCCVTMQYANRPSVELARTALHLAHTLTASEYAESKVIAEVAHRLVSHWDQVLFKQMNRFSTVLPDKQSVN